jgi:hypothetical protein
MLEGMRMNVCYHRVKSPQKSVIDDEFCLLT